MRCHMQRPSFEAAMLLHNFVNSDTVVEPEADLINVDEQRGDMDVPDRLSEADSLQLNTHGAPSHSLWYFTEGSVEEQPSNIAMRVALMERLQANNCPLPPVERFQR